MSQTALITADQPVLQAVEYAVELADLVAEVKVKQTYENPGDTNIEAVFTFPMPLDAVFLGLHVQIGQRGLAGVVMPRAQGEETYEEAVSDGDAAFMLEQAGPGLYTLNAGNILPGEQVEIDLRYTQLLAWQEDALRFFLPTTLAPRYGDPQQAGLQEHQVPDVAIGANNSCQIQLNATGRLARGTFHSPSHPITVQAAEHETRVMLTKDRTWMDRDFVLHIDCPASDRVFALAETGPEETVVLASFQPILDSPRDARPRAIQIVVDCSGSMGGDSIAQARVALREILAMLHPQDYFNIIRFGSRSKALFPSLVPADAQHLDQARGELICMDADMGGTEIGPAIEQAIDYQTPRDLDLDVLLITDGEIWNSEPVVKRAAQSSCRFFTVGVGSAVSEPFLRQLAEATGGACELVAPNEEMADRIVHHFRRLYSPRMNGTVQWPARPDGVTPENLEAIFQGDTVNIFARFAKPVQGAVGLQLHAGGNQVYEQVVDIRQLSEKSAEVPLLARLAAARQLAQEDLTEEEATTLAMRHQLVGPYTHCIVVQVRAENEKAQDLPELRKVAHRLAAGWSGMGSVVDHMPVDADICCEMPSLPSEIPPPLCNKPPTLRREKPFAARGADSPQSPLHIAQDPHSKHRRKKKGPRSGRGMRIFIQKLESFIAAGEPTAGILPSLDQLQAMGLSGFIVQQLRLLVDKIGSEEEVVSLFLFLLVQSGKGGAAKLSRNTHRYIRQAFESYSFTPESQAGMEHWIDNCIS